MSVRNFSPYLLDIFRLVSEKGEFRLECKDKKEALALRARIYLLRRRMREEKHWLLPSAEACAVSVEGSTLIAHRPDQPLEDKLAKALKEQGFKERTVPR